MLGQHVMHVHRNPAGNKCIIDEKSILADPGAASRGDVYFLSLREIVETEQNWQKIIVKVYVIYDQA